MTSVAVETLTEGAVLAMEVKDSFGRILMRSGIALEQQHIVTLRKCGIVEVNVAEGTIVNALEDGTDSDPGFQEMEKRLAPIFAHIDTDWDVMRIIRRTAVLQALHRSAALGENA